MAPKKTAVRKPRVAIYYGSKSDLPKLEPAFEVLKELGVPFEHAVASAHRTPERVRAFVRRAEEQGVAVFIAAAGMAAHLAGAVAASTTLPVIGIPVAAGALNGQDALLATVQMPKGFPVATVAIDGAANAALLAAQIVATGDDKLAQRLRAYRKKVQAAVSGEPEFVG